MKKIFLEIFLSFLTISSLLNGELLEGENFIGPSERFLQVHSIEAIKYNLKIKKVGLEQRPLFDKAISNEKMGFLGYYGDSLDFLIYQDILRCVFEEILEIPIRKDFHFLAPPLDSSHRFLSLEELAKTFNQPQFFSNDILMGTFPLNFAIYANHNRFGHNSVVNFTLNHLEGRSQYLKKLTFFFERLGLNSDLIASLFQIADTHLENKSGVLLQVFDLSQTYAFANKVSYASYPSGFIADNRCIGEFFLETHSSEFPHELRILLDAKTTLNPSSPFSMVRYTKIQPSKLKAWEQNLRALLQSSDYDLVKCEEYKQSLSQFWH